MGAMLKGAFGFVFESKRQKHQFGTRQKVEQMIISLDSKSNLLKVVIQSMFLILVGSLLFVVLALTACASSHVPRPQAEFISITNPTGEGRTSGYLDSSHIHQPKSQSSSLRTPRLYGADIPLCD